MRVLTQRTKNLLYRDLYDLIPIYLGCHTPLAPSSPIREIYRQCHHQTRRITTTTRRPSALATESNPIAHHDNSLIDAQAKLPLACPGCGAPTQTLHKGDAGYYTLGRTSVRNYTSPKRASEQEVVKHAMGNVPESLRQQLGIDVLTGEGSSKEGFRLHTLTSGV
jgi:hypothetical protein